MMREDFFARCQCGCDIIQFGAYYCVHDDVGISVYDVRPGLSFCQRLRGAWRVLRGRHAYVHETILSREDQLRLAEWLREVE